MTIISSSHNKLSKYLQENNYLTKYYNILYTYGYKVGIAVELEFYLSDKFNLDILSEYFGYKVEKEKAELQYEIHIDPIYEWKFFLSEIESIYYKFKDFHSIFGSKINIFPKPFRDNYGNAVQFNISILDSSNNNIFNVVEVIEHFAEVFCRHMEETFFIFAPLDGCYRRFVPGFLSPTHICFGPNNRSAAIRIPAHGIKRIEHRIASHNIDYYSALCVLIKCVILSLRYGINKNHNLKIYGNAWDPIYSLKKLPLNVHASISCFDINFFEL